jgi:hypothetical protein
MEAYILIKMFQGIHDGVELFWNEKDAEKAYKEYTEQDYPQERDDFENIHEDFRDTIISIIEIPEECSSPSQCKFR